MISLTLTVQDCVDRHRQTTPGRVVESRDYCGMSRSLLKTERVDVISLIVQLLKEAGLRILLENDH